MENIATVEMIRMIDMDRELVRQNALAILLRSVEITLAFQCIQLVGQDFMELIAKTNAQKTASIIVR